jgi:hypothetical protein
LPPISAAVAEFPEPPDLAAVAPAWTDLPTGHELWRIYLRGGPHPTRWDTFRAYGLTDARFDHQQPPPREQERRILYAAENARACLTEAFQRQRHIDTAFGDPWLVGFALTAPLQLLDLTGAWPTRAGASMAVNSGPRPRARRWSLAIYEAYEIAQGLFYASSMYRNVPCVALYERAAPSVPARPFFHRALADPLLLPALADAADEIGYTLSAPSGRHGE